MDQFFVDADEELKEEINREPTYEEVREFMEAKRVGMNEWFLRNAKRKESEK